MYNQRCFCHRMLIRSPILLSGGHMAPRSWGALRRHALRPVLLWTCKFNLTVEVWASSNSRWICNQLLSKKGRRILLLCVFRWDFVADWRVCFFSSSSSLWQQKGRRGKVFGKVNCKNIKQDCPDLDCDDPVLLPGHCCKTCPKGNNLPTQSKHLLMLFF